MPPVRRREFLAQIRLDLAGRRDLAPQVIALLLALGKDAVLLGEPDFQIGQAAAEDFGFRNLPRDSPRLS